ncbi:unnamed protein product [Parajaminaea phylloscopi]
MADHDDLYDDLYSEVDNAKQVQDSHPNAQYEDYEEPAATPAKQSADTAASSGMSFIPKKPAAAVVDASPAPSPAASSSAAGPKSSFIPVASSSSSSSSFGPVPTASKGAFIPSAGEISHPLPPTPQSHQHYPAESTLPRPIPVASMPGSLTGPNTSEDGKMFVGGLSWDTTDDGLKQYFSQFGKVVDCNIMKDPNTGTSRGFGFLRFEDPKAVNMVMVREHFLDGKIIDPKRAIPRDTSLKSSKIFVGGIPPHTTNESFRATFSQFGKILDHNLMMDKETGRPRGFGFITFETEDAGRMALGMDGQVLLDGKMVDVKRATSKNAPGNQQQNQQSQSGQSQQQGLQGMGGSAAGGMGGGMPSMDMMGMFNPMMMGMMGGAGQGSQMDPNTMAAMFQQNGWGTGSWNPIMMQQMLMAANQSQQQGAGAWNPMMMGMGGMNPMMSMGGMGNMAGMGGNDGGWMAQGNQQGHHQQQQQQQQRGFSAQRANSNGPGQQSGGMRQSPANRGGGGLRASGGIIAAGSNGLPNRPSPSTAGGAAAMPRGRDHRSASATNNEDSHRRERSPDRRGGHGSGGNAGRYEDKPLR